MGIWSVVINEKSRDSPDKDRNLMAFGCFQQKTEFHEFAG